jgi:multidrug resistance efflux pump
MVTAKAISLSVRPVQSADLCYPLSGIIEYQPEDLLGRSVGAYDLTAYRDKLEPKPELPSPADWLNINPITSGTAIGSTPIGGMAGDVPPVDGPFSIQSELDDFVLSRLRADDIAAHLTQAIAWYGLKHSADQADAAIEKRIELLGESTMDPNSLLAMLNTLSRQLRTRYQTLRDEYLKDNIGVVAAQTSEASSNARTTGVQSFNTDTTTTTTYNGREYEIPLHDNKVRWLRSEISLRQERLAAFRLVKLNSKENVLREKAMTTAEIRKIQLAYVDTFLVAPFDGVITAVFRHLGDFVTAGQPVLRVENDKSVYLIGTIKCRALIRIGDKATVSTTLFGAVGAPPVEIEGAVCAVRGHEPVDEQWNVMIRCDNQAGTGRILPLNYNFDFNNTEIEIEPV